MVDLLVVMGIPPDLVSPIFVQKRRHAGENRLCLVRTRLVVFFAFRGTLISIVQI